MSDWNKFKNKMKEKRCKNTTKKDSGTSLKDLETIVVQRLSAEVSGKAQKYSRSGAREFVPFDEFNEISIENIKKACMKHYGMPDTMCCDVLAGEQGPSCSSMKQLPSLKVIHVRFIEFTGASNMADVGDDGPARKQIKKNDKTYDKNPGPSAALSEPCTSRGSPSKFVPRSLSVAEILRLGKLITKTTDVIDIHHFDMTDMVWSGKATPVEFNIEREPFGTGGFRKAFKASGSGEFKGSTWVVKRYLENAKKDILELGQSLEEHTKKVVQMHYLARNFTAKLKEELVAQDNEILFGETFYYKKIFMGKIGEEYVTIEEFVDGTFRKYVNNNGNVCCKGDRSALFDKAECLAHFTYERSEKEVMLLDIQGCEYSLIDPEIASKELTPTDLLFCAGNLSANAISTFVTNHKCSSYCQLLGLSPLE